MQPLPEIPGQDRVKILLVDDTPDNLVSLEAALDGLGQELVLAAVGPRKPCAICWTTISRPFCWT